MAVPPPPIPVVSSSPYPKRPLYTRLLFPLLDHHGNQGGDPVSTVCTARQIMPSSGVDKVAKTATAPLGGSDSVITLFWGGPVTGNSPEKRITLVEWAVLNNFAVAGTSAPTRTFTVRTPAA